MTSLTHAKNLVMQRDNLQTQIETALRLSLQDYLDFLPQRGSSWVTHHTDATDYTFTELDGTNFAFESEEYYCYGESETDYVNLPFEFVESPETYKARILAEIQAAENAKKARIKATQEERVARLKAQLAKAEANLAKAQEQEDLIGTIALTKQTGEIRSALHNEGN